MKAARWIATIVTLCAATATMLAELLHDGTASIISLAIFDMAFVISVILDVKNEA